MIGAIIGFTLENLPAILFVIAILAGLLSRHRPRSEAFLSWLLLLAIGVTAIWAAIYHLFFPKFAAAFIGWQPSPFQFEVGVADLAYGVTACIAFWRSLPFKSAVVCISAIALLGDAVGHIHQILLVGNFAAGNAGVVFYCDILVPVAAITALVLAQRAKDYSA
jgi:hypothetical protein